MHEKLSLNLYKRTNYAKLLIATIQKNYKYETNEKSSTHGFALRTERSFSFGKARL